MRPYLSYVKPHLLIFSSLRLHLTPSSFLSWLLLSVQCCVQPHPPPLTHPPLPPPPHHQQTPSSDLLCLTSGATSAPSIVGMEPWVYLLGMFLFDMIISVIAGVSLLAFAVGLKLLRFDGESSLAPASLLLKSTLTLPCYIISIRCAGHCTFFSSVSDTMPQGMSILYLEHCSLLL